MHTIPDPTAVVVVGSFNVDHLWSGRHLPRPGQTLSGRYTCGAGGKGFNQAVAAHRAGVDTCLICALGNDAGGRLARTLAQADGLTLQAHPSAKPTGAAGIHVAADGGNAIMVEPGANADLDAESVIAHAGRIGAARVLLTQLETPPDAAAAALRIAREAGAATLLNPAPADVMISARTLTLATVLTPNESEFSALLKHHHDIILDADAVAACADPELHTLCRRLSPDGSVIVTLGAAGCFVSHREDRRHGDAQAHYRLPARPAATIDTTGAGDAFNGALAATLATAADSAAFLDHVRFASDYAARATERPGAAAAMPWQRPKPART